MSIYRIDDNRIVQVEPTTFKEQGLLERSDLQTLLKNQIDVLSLDPDTLIVAEEFGEWEESQLRIDLLGVNKDANLVVIELKRTESGDHMELQALRYAAMISTLTFDRLVTIYEEYLSRSDTEKDARDDLLEFLGWDDPKEEEFGQEVRIVLASSGFSKELTTSVMWLNDRGLDIHCVRLRPCDNDGQILLDVQTVIPIPDAEKYQIGIREKRQRERASRQKRDKYDVTIGGKRHRQQTKGGMMRLIVSGILQNSGTPEQIQELIKGKFQIFDGELTSEQIKEQLDAEGKVRSNRFFCKDEELIYVKDRTCVLSKQWAIETFDVVERLKKMFPDLNIDYERSRQDDA